MVVRKISQKQELIQFRNQANKYIGVRFPLEYLSRSHVVAIYNSDDELAGGYVLVKAAPFRVLESLPEEVRHSSSVLKSLNLDSVVEITGLWLAPEMRSKAKALVLWINLLKDVLLSGKRHFVFAYSLKCKKLGEVYQVARPRVIFQGLTKVLPGMSGATEESVEVGSTLLAAFAWLHSPQFIVKRVAGHVGVPKTLPYLREFYARVL